MVAVAFGIGCRPVSGVRSLCRRRSRSGSGGVRRSRKKRRGRNISGPLLGHDPAATAGGAALPVSNRDAERRVMGACDVELRLPADGTEDAAGLRVGHGHDHHLVHVVVAGPRAPTLECIGAAQAALGKAARLRNHGVRPRGRQTQSPPRSTKAHPADSLSTSATAFQREYGRWSRNHSTNAGGGASRGSGSKSPLRSVVLTGRS